MFFTYPAFLFALGLLSVPLIIHLFNFRKYKRVYFSNVRFLLSIQQETQSSNKIRQWLILISRLLAFACLVLAFAQPVIPGKNATAFKGGKRQISIFVDNSFSMDAQQRDGRLLDIARNYADEIADAYGDAEFFQLMTHDFEGRHQLLYTKEEFKNLLNEVSLSSSSQKLSDVIRRQQDVLLKEPENNSRIYIISDFQHTFTDIENIQLDSSLKVQLIPITPQEQQNLVIDSCWLDAPELLVGEEVMVHVRIKNYGEQAYENNLIRLKVNGQQKTPSYFSVDAGGAAEVVLNFTIQQQGEHQCLLEIDDSQILFDDQMYFSFHVKSSLQIYGIIEDRTVDYFQKIFNKDSYFSYSSAKQGNVDYGILKSKQLLVLQGLNEISVGLVQELKNYVAEGGSVIVIPGNSIDQSSYQNLSSALNLPRWTSIDSADTRLATINSEDPFYTDIFESIPKDMDLPVVKNHYVLNVSGNTNVYPILQLINGHIFYAKSPVKKGMAYMLAVPLDDKWSNFQKHALFVASMIKTSFLTANTGSLYYTIGEEEQIVLQDINLSSDQVVYLKKSDSDFECIPEQRMVENKLFIYPSSQIKEAGWYDLYLGNQKIKTIAYNHPRNESNPSVHNTVSLQESIDKSQQKGISLISPDDKTIKKLIQQSELGTPLWKLFIILSLIFLLIEILLIRFFKR